MTFGVASFSIGFDMPGTMFSYPPGMRFTLVVAALALLGCEEKKALPVHKTYKIMHDGVVLKIEADVPSTWNELLDADGSPEFHEAPAGMLADMDTVKVSPEFFITQMFTDGVPEKTVGPDGRIWVIAHGNRGGLEAAMIVPASTWGIAYCRTVLAKDNVDLLAEVKAVCDTLRVVK